MLKLMAVLLVTRLQAIARASKTVASSTGYTFKLAKPQRREYIKAVG